jgi:CRISPR/Cas system-associated protein Csm6
VATGKKAEAPARRRRAARPSEATDRYLELIRACPLRSEAELDRAIAVINRLVDRGLDNLSPDENRVAAQ